MAERLAIIEEFHEKDYFYNTDNKVVMVLIDEEYMRPAMVNEPGYIAGPITFSEQGITYDSYIFAAKLRILDGY